MLHFAPRANASTIPITVVRAAELRRWLKAQPAAVRSWLEGARFVAGDGQLALLPGKERPRGAVVGIGDAGNVWSFGGLPDFLPPGRYAFDGSLPPGLVDAAALGWALGCYGFDRYRTRNGRRPRPTLVWPAGCDRAAVERMAHGVCLARDLINVPAADLGPAELADEARKLGEAHDAKVRVVRGKALASDYPAIAAVGGGAAPGRDPCLVDLTWGEGEAPRLTLVGKGVVFDSGGLDIKPSSAMRLMKKDMGGAACVLGLAHMIMDAGLPVRLRVLVPAVENAISATAYRPGDVLRTRKGLTVEVGNTDAEGRLILADALADADLEKPDLLIDIATLTGAARIALGTDLPALFCNDDPLAAAIADATTAAGDFDPMWRMPLFRPYRRHLDSPIADIHSVDNVGKGGAITAALFLQEFVSPGVPWVHIDTMAWNMSGSPGRPAGGEAFGIRALFRTLVQRYQK
jgi:leucyl aminopeptidase